MSIPAAAVPVSSFALVLALSAAVLTLVVASLLGLLRNDKLNRFERISPDRPLAPMVGALFAGVVVFLAMAQLLFGSRSAGLSERRVILNNILVPVASLGILVLADALARRRTKHHLGLNLRNLPSGIVIGAIGMLIAMPLVYSSMVIAEWTYQRAGYVHPPEHDLLKRMGETADPLIKYLAVVAAVVVAPVWEELLFRGYVQTLLSEGIFRMRIMADPLDTRRTPREAWIAILLTSLLFASIHATWTGPPIFVLAVCLGFAYERSGNLWVPITMHAAFNGAMITYYLLAG
jgi:membrane protease YdiL (CAAX protease family)